MVLEGPWEHSKVSHIGLKTKFQRNFMLGNEETETYVHWFYFPKSNMYCKFGMVKLYFEQILGHMVGQFIPCEIVIRKGLQSYKI